MPFGVGPCAALIQVDPLLEALEIVQGDHRIRPIIGDQIGKEPAGRRARFETTVVLAGIQVKIVQRRFADERRTVHGHVHDTGPVTQ